jgi:hypothetical protein
MKRKDILGTDEDEGNRPPPELLLRMNRIYDEGHLAHLSGREGPVLMAYWRHADNDTCQAFPGFTKMSEKLNMKTSNLANVRERLVKKGFLKIVKVGGGWKTPTVVEITVPPHNAIGSDSVAAEPNGKNAIASNSVRGDGQAKVRQPAAKNAIDSDSVSEGPGDENAIGSNSYRIAKRYENGAENAIGSKPTTLSKTAQNAIASDRRTTQELPKKNYPTTTTQAAVGVVSPPGLGSEDEAEVKQLVKRFVDRSVRENGAAKLVRAKGVKECKRILKLWEFKEAKGGEEADEFKWVVLGIIKDPKREVTYPKDFDKKEIQGVGSSASLVNRKEVNREAFPDHYAKFLEDSVKSMDESEPAPPPLREPAYIADPHDQSHRLDWENEYTRELDDDRADREARFRPDIDLGAI